MKLWFLSIEIVKLLHSLLDKNINLVSNFTYSLAGSSFMYSVDGKINSILLTFISSYVFINYF